MIKKIDLKVYRKTAIWNTSRENLLDMYYIFCKAFSMSLYNEYRILTTQSPDLKDPLSIILYVSLYSCLAYKHFERYQEFLNLSIKID